MANVRLLANNKCILSPLLNSKVSFSINNLLRSKDENVPEKSSKFGAYPALITLQESQLMGHVQQEESIMVEKFADVSIISGIPEEHIKERLVRIAKAPKSAMQSGTDNTHIWVTQFETRQRWENPLMGWCSSGDPLSNMHLQFNTAEEAMQFCDKNGWEWYVEKEKPVKARAKSYGVNFSWNKRTRVSTK